VAGGAGGAEAAAPGRDAGGGRGARNTGVRRARRGCGGGEGRGASTPRLWVKGFGVRVEEFEGSGPALRV
jgi:hypothetical protein